MNDKSDLPPPVKKHSSKSDLWEELQAARAEIDQQQQALSDVMNTLDLERAEAKRLRERLAAAHMRLNVVRAAVAQPEAA
jgi:predicted  nucleic acid-binding Zn-ribbon protein